MNDRTPATTLGVTIGLLIVAALVARALLSTDRLFSLNQERVVARAFGPNCIWRPTHWPQGLASAWCLYTSHHRGDRLWITGMVLLGFAITGLPMTRTAPPRCSYEMQRGHKWPDHLHGTTSVWNLELVCGRHNRVQSARISWLYMLLQFPFVWAWPAYTLRMVVGTVRLAFLLSTDERAREAATA